MMLLKQSYYTKKVQEGMAKGKLLLMRKKPQKSEHGKELQEDNKLLPDITKGECKLLLQLARHRPQESFPKNPSMQQVSPIPQVFDKFPLKPQVFDKFPQDPKCAASFPKSPSARRDFQRSQKKIPKNQSALQVFQRSENSTMGQAGLRGGLLLAECYPLPERLKSHCESVALADELIQTKPRHGHLNTPELQIGPAVQSRQTSKTSSRPST